jgi:hypothetical protein
MSKSFSRGALYQLVWTEPLRTLSKRLGISDVGLAKRCRRANIPLPGLGYWAKKEAGKAVFQPELPSRGLGQSDFLEIGPDERRGYPEDDEEILRSTLTPPEPFPDGFSEVLARARQIVGKVRASSSLAKPHPVVAKLLQEDEKRREKQKSIPYASSFYAPIFESPFEKRRLRFMNGLLLAVSRAGGSASLRGREGQELGVTIGSQHLGFTLGPLKAPPATYPPPQLPASEKMKLELGWYQPPPEVKALWVDTDTQRLEDQIEDIAVNLFAYAEWAYRHGIQKQYEYRVQRKRELEARIRKQHEEAVRKERARIEKAAAERHEKLLADAAAWRRASDIRAYVEAQIARWTPTVDAERLSRLEAWAQWARSQAEEIDPVQGEPPAPVHT